jgi:hypothetical protein
MQLLSALSQLKAAPDADLQYLAQVESQILEKLRAPMREAAAKLAQAGGVVPPGAGPPPGGPPGGPPGPPPGGPPGAGSPRPPVGQGGGGDELRRLVASKGMR